MIDKEKQIKEIQHTVENYFEDRYKLIIDSNDLARKLYKIAVPEDSVVLSVNDWINFNKEHANELIKTREEEYGLGHNQGSKETAEKIYLQAKAIVNATKHIVQGREYLHIDALKEIVKSCGVEIKE